MTARRKPPTGPVPPKPSAARARRIAAAANAFRTAAETIGPVTPGMAVFAITRGQISMVDVVSHLVDQVAPATISLWTWCIADYEVEAFEKLLAERRIVAATLVVDRSGAGGNPISSQGFAGPASLALPSATPPSPTLRSSIPAMSWHATATVAIAATQIGTSRREGPAA